MSPAPKYPKIAAILRASIRSGELAPGFPIPTEAKLARQFDVARNTLRRALRGLERDGLVTVVPGKGRVVCRFGESPDHARDVMLGYRRVAAELRGQVERGVYPPGARLPSEKALARRYGVARETVRRALADLREANVMDVAHGIGWFVRRDDKGRAGLDRTSGTTSPHQSG